MVGLWRALRSVYSHRFAQYENVHDLPCTPAKDSCSAADASFVRSVIMNPELPLDNVAMPRSPSASLTSNRQIVPVTLCTHPQSLLFFPNPK